MIWEWEWEWEWIQLTSIKLSRIFGRRGSSRGNTSTILFDSGCIHSVLPFKIASTANHRGASRSSSMIVIRCITRAGCSA